ncbi:MAG: response regulator, partial [Merismopedia sp. SIO2A8]|nr:response regulator [Merismopedia sp. SIO2A8]
PAPPMMEGSTSIPPAVQTLAKNQTIPKILVVEDIELNQMILVEFLESMGFEVRSANNGQEAIAQWQEWAPDLIWMDMWMPIMDGYKATRIIKQQAGDHAPVIIALTANAFEKDRQIALEHGCDDFVRKPFQGKELLALITQHLGVQYSNSTNAEVDTHTDSHELQQLSILVVEDNPLNQTTMVDMLSHLNQHATLATNGIEAIQQLDRQDFDVILMDVHMPKMDGYAATEEIRSHPRQHQPVIIGVTGNATPDDRQRALDCGMDTTLFKPFSLESLQSCLETIPLLAVARAQATMLPSDAPAVKESTTGDGANTALNDRDADPQDSRIDDTEKVPMTQGDCAGGMEEGSSGETINEPPTYGPATLDRQYFEDYHSIYGEQAPMKIASKLRQFLAEMPQRITNIREAIASIDHHSIFQLTHALKSIAAYVGGAELADVCSALETEARQTSCMKYADLDQQLVLESQRLHLALEAEIATLLHSELPQE